LQNNLRIISARISIITLVGSIISLSSFYPLTAIFAQTTPAVHIEQDCLKGSKYQYQVTISGFDVQFPDNMGFFVDGNLVNWGHTIGFGGIGFGFPYGEGEHQIIAFEDSNSNEQLDPGETSASITFESINCNEGCPTVNVQHWDKVAFKIIRQNLANQLNLPYNSELDIKILEDRHGLTDLKKEILDHLGVPETQRNAIELVDIDYSTVCAYFELIPDDDSINDLTTSSLMDITPINMTQ
jgi:hypothetical protein